MKEVDNLLKYIQEAIKNENNNFKSQFNQELYEFKKC